MSNKVSEIDALKQIDALFEQLTEEEKIRIFGFISSKHSIANKSTNNTGANNSRNDSNNQFDSSTTIKQFIASKKPHGFYEQITCIGYYLEKIQGLETFGTAEITTANTEARALKIPNPSLYLADVVSKYKYFTPVGNGKKALTARGEALVEALPDREAVKLALENHPVKKKPATKKKKPSKKK